MTENEKLHHLIEFMLQTRGLRSIWNPSDLMQAFSYKLSLDEIEALMGVLISDGRVFDHTTHDGIAIMVTQETKNTYTRRLYLRDHQPFESAESLPSSNSVRPSDSQTLTRPKANIINRIKTSLAFKVFIILGIAASAIAGFLKLFVLVF